MYTSFVVLYAQMSTKDQHKLKAKSVIPHQKPSDNNSSTSLEERTHILRVYFWNHMKLFDPARIDQWTYGNNAQGKNDGQRVRYEPIPAGRLPKTYALLTEGYIVRINRNES